MIIYQYFIQPYTHSLRNNNNFYEYTGKQKWLYRLSIDSCPTLWKGVTFVCMRSHVKKNSSRTMPTDSIKILKNVWA